MTVSSIYQIEWQLHDNDVCSHHKKNTTTTCQVYVTRQASYREIQHRISTTIFTVIDITRGGYIQQHIGRRPFMFSLQ